MKLNRIPILFITLILLSVACTLPASVGEQQPSPIAISQAFSLVTPDPNATVTPTPFMPVGPTPTVLPTQVPPTATIPAAAGTSTPVPLMDRLKRPDGQVNILIFGSDWRPNSGYRTDVIMLLSLNKKNGTANVISFPRDLWVLIPGWEMQRINTAQAHGGFVTTVATFQYNFGVTPDHYVMTNFEGFKGIIDTFGGIDVHVARGLTDRCDLPQAVNKYCSVGPGTVHMNGATALWYVRSRHSSNDFDRTRRAQEVIQATFLKLLSLNAVSRAPELWNLFKSSIETDMTLNDIDDLLPLAKALADTSKISRYAIGPGEVTNWVTDSGAQVLLPNQEAIWEIIAKAVYGQ
ncbi:MAG TPA: LCP family protein [Anaerolineaceae bacterium]|nr:LCP family protein [Anaerolineaceae bacterium]